MTNPKAQFEVILAFSTDDLPAWIDDDLKAEAEEMFEDYDGERCLLLVNYDGEIDNIWDGGEPEDNTFARDHAWIPGALTRAYELGVRHGRTAEAASLANEEARKDAGL